jgi:uncharacterized membrane protein
MANASPKKKKLRALKFLGVPNNIRASTPGLVVFPSHTEKVFHLKIVCLVRVVFGYIFLHIYCFIL